MLFLTTVQPSGTYVRRRIEQHRKELVRYFVHLTDVFESRSFRQSLRRTIPATKPLLYVAPERRVALQVQHGTTGCSGWAFKHRYYSSSSSPDCRIDVQTAPTGSFPPSSKVLSLSPFPLMPQRKQDKKKQTIDIPALYFNFTWIIPEGKLAIQESPGHKGSLHIPAPKHTAGRVPFIDTQGG